MHEAAQATALVGDIECGRELFGIGDVGGGEGGRRTETFGDGLAVGRGQVDQGDQAAGVDDPLGGGQAQTGGATGDRDGESLEFQCADMPFEFG